MVQLPEPPFQTSSEITKGYRRSVSITANRADISREYHMLRWMFDAVTASKCRMGVPCWLLSNTA